MSDPRRPCRSFVAIDLRALATLRVGLGLFVLYDVVQRATSLRAHYTDAGVLPRTDVLQQFAWLHEWGLSVHLYGGSTLSQTLLFAVHALAGLALVVGFRTTAATVVVWFLTSSVQLRNLYIGGGFDALLRLLLLWGMFLPLGARASVDRRLRPAAVASTNPHASVAGVALLLQMAIVYFAAGVAKAENPLWLSGDALALTLRDEFFATAFGVWLGEWTALCRLAAWGVLVAEIAGPPLLLLLAPLPWVRAALVAALLLMNLGFGLALSVGPFPWIAGLGLLMFLPAEAWDRLAASSGPVRKQWSHWLDRLAPALQPLASDTTTHGSPRGLRRAAHGFCAALLAYTLYWNVSVARDPAFNAPESLRWFGHTLFLQQSWRMFAQPSSITGWLVIRGELVGGAEVDLLAAGGPVPGDDAVRPVAWDRPESVVGTTADIRWRQLLRRVSSGEDTHAALLYGRYLCREWNEAHSGDEQLASFAIIRMVKDLSPSRTADDYRRETLWTHNCFG